MTVVLKPPSTLLIGPTGVGKTWALITYVKAGLKLFSLITDPGGEETLIDACIAQNIPLDNVHWCYVPALNIDWSTMQSVAKIVNNMTYQGIGEMKAGIDKQKPGMMQFMELLNSMANFKCDRTGEVFGPIDRLGPDCAFALDSFTGVNVMAQTLHVGAKPNPHPGEWQTMMDMEYKLIVKLTSSMKCFTCVIAHIERESDFQGSPKLMISALGSKLAPKIPSWFSDVVYAYKTPDNKFLWSTSAPTVDLKSRALPLSNTIQPDFGQIVESYRRRMKAIEAIAAPASVAATQGSAKP